RTGRDLLSDRAAQPPIHAQAIASLVTWVRTERTAALARDPASRLSPVASRGRMLGRARRLARFFTRPSPSGCAGHAALLVRLHPRRPSRRDSGGTCGRPPPRARVRIGELSLLLRSAPSQCGHAIEGDLAGGRHAQTLARIREGPLMAAGLPGTGV